MKRMRIALVAAAAVSALALAGCAERGRRLARAESPSSEPRPRSRPAPRWRRWPRRARSRSAPSSTSRCSASSGPDGEPGRLRRRDRQDHRGANSASPRTNIEWVETVSANREPFIQNGQVDIVVATYTINDKRKEVVSFAGPYYEAGQSILVLADNEDITSDGRPRRPAGLLGHAVRRRPTNIAAYGATRARDRHVLQLPRAAAQRRGRRRDDRQRHPRRPRRPERGRVQGRRQAVHRGALRNRPRARRHRVPRLDQRRARRGVRGRHARGGVERHGRQGASTTPSRRQSTATDRIDAARADPAGPRRSPRPHADDRKEARGRGDRKSAHVPRAASARHLRCSCWPGPARSCSARIVAAMRISPVASLARVRHRVHRARAQHPAHAGPVLLRVHPALLGSRLDYFVLGHDRAHGLHLAVRRRGAALRHQRGAASGRPRRPAASGSASARRCRLVVMPQACAW